MIVKVEDLKGGEVGCFHSYDGRVCGPPLFGEPFDEDSVRFTMLGNGWMAKVFARRGEPFHVE